MRNKYINEAFDRFVDANDFSIDVADGHFIELEVADPGYNIREVLFDRKDLDDSIVLTKWTEDEVEIEESEDNNEEDDVYIYNVSKEVISAGEIKDFLFRLWQQGLDLRKAKYGL